MKTVKNGLASQKHCTDFFSAYVQGIKPFGLNFPVVSQYGKWRRALRISVECGNPRHRTKQPLSGEGITRRECRSRRAIAVCLDPILGLSSRRGLKIKVTRLSPETQVVNSSKTFARVDRIPCVVEFHSKELPFASCDMEVEDAQCELTVDVYRPGGTLVQADVDTVELLLYLGVLG